MRIDIEALAVRWFTHAGAPYVDRDGKVCRDIGGGVYVAEYTSLVEALFPGCAWRAPVGHPAPTVAVADGEDVCLLMCTGCTPATSRGA